MTARFIAPLAVSLAVSASLVPAQEPAATWQLLLSTNPGSGPSTTLPISTFGTVSGSADGGWVAAARLRPAAGVNVPAIFGVLNGASGAAPGLVRQGGTVAGFQQSSIRAPYLAGGEVTYAAENAQGTEALFRDDQLLVRTGDPIAGTGLAWQFFDRWKHLADGRVWVSGRATGSEGHLVELTSGQVIAAAGQVFGGSAQPALSIGSFDVDSQLGHWAALVNYATFPQSQRALVVDGDILELEPGYLAREGDRVPPSMSMPPARYWRRFFTPQVNAAGDVSFVGSIGTNDVFPQTLIDVVVKNGVIVEQSDTSDYSHPVILEMDEQGSLATTEQAQVFAFTLSTRVKIDGVDVAATEEALDADDDGRADPAWAPYFDGFSNIVSSGADGALYLVTPVDYNDGSEAETRSTVSRYHFALPKDTVCDGEPNSVGSGASLRALGSNFLALGGDVDFTLAASGLPSGALTLLIASRTTGFVANPAGSQGNLCLSGAIGRFQQSVFTAGLAGMGALAIDLGAIPQPSGIPTAAVAGETWYFQAWYRDLGPAGATSNFSDAVGVALR